MTQDNDWKGLKIAEDIEGEYHAYPDGTPAYEERYICVDDFSGGLAVVEDFDEYEFHITPDGKPAYDERYYLVWNFSDGLARAVNGTGWLHIKPDGTPAYEERYEWVGDFNNGIARASDFKGNKFKINKKGERVENNDTR
jgi:hypothetical protein